MNDIVKYFDTVEGSFKRVRLLMIVSLACAAFIAVGSVVLSVSFVSSRMDQVYVIDTDGMAYSAVVADDEVDRERECRLHVEMFHNLMFRVTPYEPAIKRSVDAALAMCDRSAYNYYSDLSEKGFYQRMVSANIVQDFAVDSVKVNMNTYPYEMRTYAKLYVLRESNITAYEFESTGRLVDVGRSDRNPNGLMLERFTVVRNDKIETRRR